MVGFLIGWLVGWWRIRAARPLLWWLVALLAYVVFPLPEYLVLALVVGLGVALTVAVRRLREDGRPAVDHAERAWDIAERLTAAVEDRIRYAPSLGQHAAYGQPVPQLAPTAVVYDPRALLAAVVAVLDAEGIPTDAALGLPPCAQLLTWQGIALAPGAPAPTALALAAELAPGGQRYRRAVPVSLFTGVLAAILAADGVLPSQLNLDDAQALTEGTAALLQALHIAPDPGSGSPGSWPVMAEVLDAARQYPGGW